MTTIAFDTLKASRKLKAAGFAEAQADAMVDTVAEAFTDTADLKAEIAAVRADIEKLEASTKGEIAGVRAELKAELAGVKADLKIIKYFFGPAIILLLLKIAFF